MGLPLGDMFFHFHKVISWQLFQPALLEPMPNLVSLMGIPIYFSGSYLSLELKIFAITALSSSVLPKT
jgi:hypothetical protein